MAVKYNYYTVKIDREQYERLRQQADRSRETIAEKVRTYIEWGLENDTAV